jgi:hypothetical protein
MSAGHRVAAVVVDPQHVDRAGDHRQVAVVDDRLPPSALPGQRLCLGEQVGGVGAAEDGVEEEPVVQGVDPPGRSAVERVVGIVRVGDRQVERDPEVGAGAAPPQLVDHQSVPEHQVVRGDQPGHALLPPGGVLTAGVAEERRAPRLVEGGPGRHPVADRVVQRERELREPVGRVAVGPPARVLEGLRQVPVVERQPGLDPVGQQLVDQPLVEVDARQVDRTSVGAHPGPRRREAVGPEVERAHQGDVLRHPVVVVARDVTGVAAEHGPGHLREDVPDRRPAPVLEDRALDLVRRGRGTPEEVVGELDGRRCGGRGRGERRGGSGHPLTAPCMMPVTNCLPVAMNRTSRGIVANVAPARTSA